jgi:hypothetical protein
MSVSRDISISDKLFLNCKESCLTGGTAALENAYQNELGGISRFPGLKSFATLSGNANTYLHEWQEDLIAVSGSRIWRVDKNGVTTEVTGVQLSGKNRVVFDRTPNELIMAAGGPILRLAAGHTELLSADAPESTHVGYVGGYVLATETNTGLIYNSAANNFQSWSPLDVFAIDSKPDFVNAMIITPFNEILLSGKDSLEQWEQLPAGSVPAFQYRWSIGQGNYVPYSLTFADNGVWNINRDQELVRSSGQLAQQVSDSIHGGVLEPVDDFSDAWCCPIMVAGQKFVMVQIPHATNIYGTTGITVLYDYRQHKWFSLFGWDNDLALPKIWPGVSYYRLWGKHFIGAAGKIYELSTTTYANGGDLQRVLWRSGNQDLGEIRIDNLMLRLKRGVGESNTKRKLMRLRVSFDGKPWTKWRKQDLGLYGENVAWVDFGQMGCGNTFQVEIDMTDSAEFELVKMRVLYTPLG